MSSTGTSRDDGWRALHVHLPHSLQTAFLRDVIRPVVRAGEGGDRFFFLRYWQGGPHIRLRIDGAAPERADAIRAALLAGMPAMTAELSAEYDYEVSLQADLARLEGESTQAIRAPGTVEPMAYLPEYAKYGGVEGVRIAEELFCRTSAAVLDLAAARPTPEPKAPVGEAIRIMAMSLRGSGLDLDQSRQFLGGYEEFWRRYVPEGYDRTWDGLYERTRPKVLELCEAVWREGRTDVFHDIYANALTAARQAGTASGEDLGDLVLGGTPYTRCLSNYIHTTNNRLGIIPAGEAFVAHVMHRSLSEIGARTGR
ncbi:lantibiotic dehydratase C-terminal domain-containing protein [Streptomyces sp. NPDC006530]|uniref:lantibiotic dehydratase C-terminal domain-containing protein n=1 Tax=Streptomyces sp. NPDC006530 TaxID=3364750 RepID=UPI003676E729